MTRPVWVPLTVERHGLRRWHRYADFGFARHRRAVPLVLDEVEAVAASLPVVFGPPAAAGLPDDPRTPAVPPADGPPPGLIPLALLASDPAGASPFVSDDGRWLTLYVPALLRVHPFAARATGAGAQMALLVDEASGHVTDDARAERFHGPWRESLRHERTQLAVPGRVRVDQAGGEELARFGGVVPADPGRKRGMLGQDPLHVVVAEHVPHAGLLVLENGFTVPHGCVAGKRVQRLLKIRKWRHGWPS